MSAPYPQQSNSDGGRRSFELKEVLAMVAAGAGAVGYLLGFFDDGVGALMGSMAGFGLICSAALAGLRFVPKTPDALFVAVPLSAYAALALLQDVVRNTASGLVAVLMVLALAQLAAVVGALLIEGGVIKSAPASPQPKPYGQPPFPQGQRGPGGPGAARPGPGGPPAPGWSPQGQPGAQFGGPPPWNPTGGQPAQQPAGNRNSSSDGFATPNPDSSGPHQNRPANQSGPIPQAGQQPQTGQQQAQNGQPQQPKPESDSGGPQGTRQMPHPGANPPAF